MSGFCLFFWDIIKEWYFILGFRISCLLAESFIESDEVLQKDEQVKLMSQRFAQI